MPSCGAGDNIEPKGIQRWKYMHKATKSANLPYLQGIHSPAADYDVILPISDYI